MNNSSELLMLGRWKVLDLGVNSGGTDDVRAAEPKRGVESVVAAGGPAGVAM